MIAVIAFLAFAVIAGFTIYKYVRYGIVEGGGIFASSLAVSYFLNWVKWGDHEGGGEKDELDRHIETQSAKIGYFLLMILAALILFISEGVTNLNDIQNYPLLLVVSLSFVILPITELIYSRKFKS